MATALSLSAYAARQRARHALLQAEICELYVELDELRHEAIIIAAKYEARLGPAQLEMLQLEREITRLRRKRELIVNALERGARPDFDEIEATLAHELQHFNRSVAEARRRYAEARGALDSLTPNPNGARLRRLYCKIVRRLHPDLHPYLYKGELEGKYLLLWTRSRYAFDLGRTEELEQIWALLANEKEVRDGDARSDDERPLSAHIETLERTLHKLKEKRALRLRREPLVYRSHIDDEIWLEARRAQILSRGSHYRALIGELSAELAALEASLSALSREP